MRTVAGFTLAALAALLLVPATPAQASLGSVPVVVSDYVATGQLTARLEQLYGPGKKKGSGVDFDETTKPGPISRVYEWTDDRYAHADSEHPIQLTNYWTVPISIGGEPAGVAAVWINPQSDLPELAQFTASVPLATALANVPADAALVHDDATSAWFAVAGGTANPLVAGRSGVTTATPVADLRLTRATSATAAGADDPNTGMALALAVLVLLVFVIVLTLVLPGRLRRRGGDAAEATASAVRRDEEAEPLIASTREPERAAEPDGGPEPTPAPTRTAASTARASSSRSRATAAGPRSAAAVAKPRTPVSQKPPVSKPTGTKPTASKPAVAKPGPSKPGSSTPSPSKPSPSKPSPSKPSPSKPSPSKPSTTKGAPPAESSVSDPPVSERPARQPPAPRGRAKKPPPEDAPSAEG